MPEFEDAAFGPRASAVHTRLQEALLAAGHRGARVLVAIPRQMEVIAMLRHINSELKVCEVPSFSSQIPNLHSKMSACSVVVLAAIPGQMEVVIMLCHINSKLKVDR